MKATTSTSIAEVTYTGRADGPQVCRKRPRKIDLELGPLGATSWWREDGYGTMEGEEEEIPPYTRPPSAAYKAWYARQGFDKQGKVSERKRRSRVKLGVVGRQKAARREQAARREAKRKRMEEEEEEEEVGAVRRAQMAGAAVLRAFSRGGS